MSKVLLANIGNRNIKLNGEFITKDFRSTTKALYERKLEERPVLELVIINTLLEQGVEKPDHIVLFASAQATGRQDQDTEFAAYLVKDLLEQAYQIPTEVHVLKCSVVDHNQLIRNYKTSIRQLVDRYSHDASFWLNDSGGTAQQKASLRIVLHFLLPVEQIRIFQVNQSERNESTVVESQAIEYQKILLFEQLKAAIDKLDYGSAISLLNTKPQQCITSRAYHKRLMTIGYALEGAEYKSIKKTIETVSYRQKPYEQKMANYLDDEWLIKCDDDDLLPFRAKMSLSVYANIAAYHWQNKPAFADEMIRYAQFFAEHYLDSIIEHHFQYQLSNRRKRNKELKRLDQDFRMSHPELIPSNSQFKIGGSLFSLMEVAYLVDDEQNQKYIELLRKCVNDGSERWQQLHRKTGLNILRNNMAHKGWHYTFEDLEKEWPDYDDWVLDFFNNWHLKPESNVFHVINKAIEDDMLR